MKKVFKTKSGKILTEEDIQRLADEAEKGYDICSCGKCTARAEYDGYCLKCYANTDGACT